jgi:hypothetical protein
MRKEFGMEKAFRGSWAPPELWELLEEKTINKTEFVLIMLIDSFVKSSGEDCYASAGYLAQRVGISEKEATRNIARLKKDGFLIETKNDGRKRWMHSFWSRPLAHSRGAEKRTSDVRKSAPREDISLEDIPPLGGRDIPAPPIPKSPNVEGEPSKPPTSAKFQRVFIRLWVSHYPGQTYKFHGAKDGAAFKSMFTHFKGDKAKFKEVVRRYLDDESDFFRGHPAFQLNAQLNRFLAPTESEGPDIRVTTVADDGSPINFD